MGGPPKIPLSRGVTVIGSSDVSQEMLCVDRRSFSEQSGGRRYDSEVKAISFSAGESAEIGRRTPLKLIADPPQPTTPSG